jgi:hypothetical protein
MSSLESAIDQQAQSKYYHEFTTSQFWCPTEYPASAVRMICTCTSRIPAPVMLPSSFLQLATAIPTQSRLLASQPSCLAAILSAVLLSPKACQVFLARTRRLTDTAASFWYSPPSLVSCFIPSHSWLWLLAYCPSLLVHLTCCSARCSTV